jgi:sialic acid synthase SpsE
MKVVAELGASHGGSLQTALDLMYAAKEAGCDAFKLQTLTPENIAAPGVLLTKGPWAGRELRDLYREVMTPWDWHPRLFAEGSSLGIEVFSTAFDVEAVAFLESLETPRHKIASPEISDYRLIEAIAATGKPVYVSDGLASPADLRKALLILSGREVTVLRCVSEYPADPASFGIGEIAEYSCSWGLSDHSLTTTAAVVATVMGAQVIEKHIRMPIDGSTPDCRFAITPEQMQETVQAVRDARAMLTTERPANGSHGGLKKSLWIIKPVEAGEVASDANVRALRPDDGCDPFLWPVLKGGRFRASHPANVPLEEAMISLDDERT